MTYWNRNSYVLPKLTTLNADPMGKLFRNSNSVCLAASILFPVIEPKANRIVKCMYKHLPVVLDFIQYKLKTNVTRVVGMVNSLQKTSFFVGDEQISPVLESRGVLRDFQRISKSERCSDFCWPSNPAPKSEQNEKSVDLLRLLCSHPSCLYMLQTF